MDYKEIAKKELILLIDEFEEMSVAKALYAINAYIGRKNITDLYEMQDKELYEIIEKVIDKERETSTFTINDIVEMKTLEGLMEDKDI